MFLGSSVVYIRGQIRWRIMGAKRRKDRSTPPVKTTESMSLFFFEIARWSFLSMEDVWYKVAAITDHLEMFVDVPDKAFEEIHDRMVLNVLTILRDDCNGRRLRSPVWNRPGSNDRATKIPANIFGKQVLGSPTVGFR